jgi:hypothetical protein
LRDISSVSGVFLFGSNASENLDGLKEKKGELLGQCLRSRSIALPRILREEFCGMISKSKAVDHLKSLGVAQATAYRWLEKAIEEQILKFKDDHIFL